ncbi:efflux RND transporter periplasmic adaptor subunit [Paenibacillus montanisoli]|uniref:efflux RND transporter periplasmic adaptor subunit n=1 Tax=Paenibacillus montanisoli TaxID=2081970 RepID=UPI0014022D98|nr:efflux RND transporter periplasmic adaptor subunit [Paenibacillus montanisoli]
MSQNLTPKKRRRLFVREAAAVMVAASLLSGCSLLPQKQVVLQPPLVQPAAEKVDAIDVKKATIERSFTGAAVVASSKTVPLFYKEGGRLKALHVQLGDRVEAGKVVAELDLGDLDLRVKLQELSLERVRIEYNRARQSGVTGTELRMKEIDLEREQLLLDNMNEQYEAAKLTSPVSGVVTYVDAKSPGDGLNGYTPLVSVSDPKQIYLVYTADDPKLISGIQREMPVDITINGSKYEGKVLQSPSDAPITLNKEIDERNSRLLYIQMNKPDESIELGQSAQIHIVLEKKADVVVIPRSGLRTYLGRTYVQSLDGDRRKEIDVQPGIMTATEVEIVKGLEPGMKVILNN